MRRTVVLATLALARLAFAGPYGEGSGAGRCPAVLGSNVYQCSVKGEDGSSFTDCFRFGGTQVSSKFDLASDLLGSPIGCSCNPGGSPANPTFGATALFTCTTSLGIAVEARVMKDGSIRKGTVTSARGGSYAFSCQPNASCTVGP